MNRTLGTLVALALVALIGAGCGGDGGGDAAANDDNAATRDKAVQFAECMRSNGVPQFPDPDGSGELTIDAVVNGSGISPDSPEWNQAIDACEDLQPPGFTGPENTPERREQALELAECIRENGVPDFPDPEPDGPPIDTNRIPSAATDAGMNALNAAMQACGGIMDGTAGQ